MRIFNCIEYSLQAKFCTLTLAIYFKRNCFYLSVEKNKKRNQNFSLKKISRLVAFSIRVVRLFSKIEIKFTLRVANKFHATLTQLFHTHTHTHTHIIYPPTRTHTLRDTHTHTARSPRPPASPRPRNRSPVVLSTTLSPSLSLAHSPTLSLSLFLYLFLFYLTIHCAVPQRTKTTT